MSSDDLRELMDIFRQLPQRQQDELLGAAVRMGVEQEAERQRA